MYHIDMQVAHAQVALLCMCYIAAVIEYWSPSDTKMVEMANYLPQFGTTTRTSYKRGLLRALPYSFRKSEIPGSPTPTAFSDRKTGIGSLPLLHYAFRHGFRHLECLESASRAIIDGMIALRSDIRQHPVEWQRICELAILRLPSPSWILPAAQHDYIICILIFLLPEPFLRAFLRRAPFKAMDGTNPLIYATYSDKIEHARTLLSCGVSHVNCTGLDVQRPRQVLPLEVAFYQQHYLLFDLFLSDWRVTVPLRLYSSAFNDRYFERPSRIRIATLAKFLQCDEFAEWEADGQHKQSLLRVLDYDCCQIVESVEQEAITMLLRRLVQVGCDFSRPDSLESMLRVTLNAMSRRRLVVLLYLCSLDVPMPSRVLFIGGTTLVRELALQGLDVNAIMTHGDIALHRAFGECKHGSSCWALDCDLCSVFIRAMGPQVSQKFIHQYIRFISRRLASILAYYSC